MNREVARSCTPAVRSLLAGPVRTGVGLGHGHVQVGRYVLTLTLPGGSRMPNGLECGLSVEPGDHVLVGDGCVQSGLARVVAGPTWDPRPPVRFLPFAAPEVDVDLEALEGFGPGLTPFGDDLRSGYAAGAVLVADGRLAVPGSHADATTSLARTLLWHAARGELCAPAHDLLAHGDVRPLLSWGSSSGVGVVLGLALAAHRACAQGCAARTDRASSAHAARLVCDLPAGRSAYSIAVYRCQRAKAREHPTPMERERTVTAGRRGRPRVGGPRRSRR